LGLAPIGVVMMMIRAGKLGCRMFGRMFVFGRGMHGAHVGAVACQSVAMTRHGAARTGRRSTTA
jgi:hypothetical protein